MQRTIEGKYLFYKVNVRKIITAPLLVCFYSLLRLPSYRLCTAYLMNNSHIRGVSTKNL